MMPVEKEQHNTSPAVSKEPRRWVFDLLLIYVLLAGAYFRFTGINWGEYQYLHPDERFLVWVGSDIAPVGSWSEYFDAANSSLNPNNRGHGFYVYGTLPMFLTRYVVEGVYGHSGFNEMTNIGRPLSALADLLTVLVVFGIGVRLYGKRAGLLAAAFLAAAVLPIQQSHFFTMDTYQNLFTYLALYFAIRVSLQVDEEPVVVDNPLEDEASLQLAPAGQPGKTTSAWRAFTRHPLFLLSVGFGVALGCAAATKLSAAPVAFSLPLAFGLRLLRTPAEKRERQFVDALLYLVAAALVSLLVFRLFQPYAFSGPGFFGLKPNPQWVQNIREQRDQAAGDVDYPPSLQWARRPVWFSGANMVLWGMGLPLGLLSLAGFAWAGWRMLADKSAARQALHRHGLLWAWTAFYFIWQSLQFNPTMRYQLPVYPAFMLFGAWAVVKLYDLGKARLAVAAGSERQPRSWRKMLALVVGGVVLVVTYVYAFGFSQIYARPITRVAASRWIYQNAPGPITLQLESAGTTLNQPLPFPYGGTISAGQPYVTQVEPKSAGTLREIYLPHVVDLTTDPGPKVLKLAIISIPDDTTLATAILTSNFNARQDPRGEPYTLQLEPGIEVLAGQPYRLQFELESGNGALNLSGAALANEGAWDDGLPLRLNGYDGFGGLYQPGLNFDMYTPDDPEKLARFLSIFEQADYLLISSSRQWGSLPRLPERFPLSAFYYRSLLGCPPERTVEWCYNVAQPGIFSGELGFELVEVFQSDPALGPWRLNDQASEEAFTVYDHPKVFIFQKSPEYNPAQAQSILGGVDFSEVVHITPKRASSYPANLKLPPARWAEQQSGGTWSQLFDSQALINRSQPVAVVVWYLTIFFIGLLAYPLVRRAFPGLADHGYPLARLAGMLVLSYLVWLLGSFGIPFSRVTIVGVLIGILIISLVLAWSQRLDLRQEWRRRGQYFTLVEILFLAFFLLDLAIRVGNPDLWHPWKGGEKPMDFAYFNAILKSTSFPPFDPWYTGGYLNYYYYGLVLVGVPVKLLGIEPAIAYNLILPTVFAMIAMGAFSLGWNIYAHVSRRVPSGEDLGEGDLSEPGGGKAWLAGLAGALGMALLGNLGTARMIYQGYQRLAAPGGAIEGAGLLIRWIWALRGFVRAISGDQLPYSLGDWYWIPSRAIPAPQDVEPITEFPFFTVLYADLHAHLLALPVTLLALSFAFAIVAGRARWRRWGDAVLSFLLGGLAIGALRPTNTWDFYPYLALGLVAVGYAVWVNFQPLMPRAALASRLKERLAELPSTSQRLLVSAMALLSLVVLAYLLFQPYARWYALGYGEVGVWRGTHTPLSAYLVHWGLFLFVILAWMAWETHQWLAQTPLSALRKLEPYKGWIQVLSLALLLVIAALIVGFKVAIAWFVLPLAAWAGVLILRPGQPDAKRFVLFLVGTSLVLTLTVETIVLRGDIGRMNTVFKFYLQVWTLLAVSSAAALGWLWDELEQWSPGWRLSWQFGLVVLVGLVALFPLLGSVAKIKDRMALEAPHTLDGMRYMAYAQYADTWGNMDLSEDYRAIRWMQENVSGSPVIVEANLRDLYRWGSRFTIYTGLPGVVGWEWHQQQQRAVLPGTWVSDRIAEIDRFYQTTDLNEARQFLQKYQVRYIVLGQQERGKYPGEGLEKFIAAEGVLWRAVYQDGATVLYEVLAP